MPPSFDWMDLGQDIWRLVCSRLDISVRLQEDRTGVNRLVHTTPLVRAVCRAFRALYDEPCSVRGIRIRVEPETVVGDGLYCDAWQGLIRSVVARPCHRLEVCAPEGNQGAWPDDAQPYYRHNHVLCALQNSPALMLCTELSLVLNWSVKDVYAWAMVSPLLQSVRRLQLGQAGTMPLFPDEGELDCYAFLLCTGIKAPPNLAEFTVRDAWLGLLPTHCVTPWRRIDGVHVPINMKFSHMVSRMRLGSASIVDLDRCSVFPDGLDQTTMLGGMLSTVPPQCAIRVRIGRRVLYECRQADHSYRGLLVNLFHTSSSLFRGVSAAMHPFPAIHFE